LSGFIVFLLLHTQQLDPGWFAPGALHNVVGWLYNEGPNPFSCAAMGEFRAVSGVCKVRS